MAIAAKSQVRTAIFGGGPAGLMAAEVLLGAGESVDLYDSMPSVGRKFLLAGVGGLNLTHAEPQPHFIQRYGARGSDLGALLTDFDAAAIQAWASDLGIATFVGSSQRIFPTAMKAAPLLRAWLHRLRSQGLRIHVRHRCLGWDGQGAWRMQTPHGEQTLTSAWTILALGGGSWSRLGSDGAWVPWLRQSGVAVHPLKPSNCGFEVAWRAPFKERHAGAPVKAVSASLTTPKGVTHQRLGEFTISHYGVEGGLIYSLSAALRDTIEHSGRATLHLDLLPHLSAEHVLAAVSHPRGSRSLASHLQSRLNITGVKAGLLREILTTRELLEPHRIATTLKALALPLIAARPLDEAISSAGGVDFSALTPTLMLRQHPGVFCAGEMLDWEAPTGGYLLSGCLASGRQAGIGALTYLKITNKIN